jgi:F-type H+-transporting ATPase subunit b
VKNLIPWVVVFVVLLGFAYLVDHGKTFVGLPVFFWLALNLTVFLYLLARYVGKPIVAFLDARKEGIAAELKEAKDKLAQAEALKADVLERLEKIEGEVAAIRDRAEEQGQQEAVRIAEQAEAEEQRFLQRVGDEITRRKEETRQALIEETAKLTAQIAEDLLKKHMTDADRKRVLGESIDALRSVEGRT